MLSSACISILRRIVLTPFGGAYNQVGYARGICGGGGDCTGGAGCAGGLAGAGVASCCASGGTRAVIISSDMPTLINTGRKDSLVRMSALG